MKVLHISRTPNNHPLMSKLGRLLFRHILPTIFALGLLAASMILVKLYL